MHEKLRDDNFPFGIGNTHKNLSIFSQSYAFDVKQILFECTKRFLSRAFMVILYGLNLAKGSGDLLMNSIM